MIIGLILAVGGVSIMFAFAFFIVSHALSNLNYSVWQYGWFKRRG